MNKDVNFFDNFRTGDILSRLGSDTQVVQEGLTTNVAMFIKALCIMIGTIVIIFFYDPVFAVIVILCIAPSIFVTRFGANAINKFGARYQKAKGEMSNIGTESW